MTLHLCNSSHILCNISNSNSRELPVHEDDEVVLHAAEIESLERRIMEIAMERTRSTSGAIFLHDRESDGLVVDFHVVDGVTFELPHVVLRRRKDGRPSGIAMWVLDHGEPYLCADSTSDPHYAPYFHEVRSIAAVPVIYQHQPMGVITVSSHEPDAFSVEDLDELEALAGSSTIFLRRAQLSRSKRSDEAPRPYLIKGLSPQWKEVENMIERVSPTDAAVLIQGESGTGKELVASAIHFNSERVDRPFVTVNCAAIPETMLESVLFGHVRGAFTGASFDKKGEFQKADGGTLFLDEMGELPLALQAKVLRALEQGEVQPLGSNDPPARVDIRVICATNRDLAAMVRSGEFRDDLYYRLCVVTVQLPPLRDYKNNLPTLSRVFVEQAARRVRKPTPAISARCLAALTAYDFPGNVRELKNAMEHAVIMANEMIEPVHLPPSMTASEPLAPAAFPTGTLRELRERWLHPLERRYLSDLLTASDGNVRRAADRAGVNVVTMYRLLKKRGLRIRRTVVE